MWDLEMFFLKKALHVFFGVRQFSYLFDPPFQCLPVTLHGLMGMISFPKKLEFIISLLAVVSCYILSASSVSVNGQELRTLYFDLALIEMLQQLGFSRFCVLGALYFRKVPGERLGYC